MAPRSPLFPISRLLATFALLAAAGCPGFGDRLPPDAGLADADRPDLAAGDDAERPGTDAERPDLAVVEPDAAVAPPTYEPEIADFMERHCSLCHGETPVGGAPYALVTWEQSVEYAAAIVDRVVTRRDMPPGGGLVTDEERDRLVAWVAAGTPR